MEACSRCSAWTQQVSSHLRPSQPGPSLAPVPLQVNLDTSLQAQRMGDLRAQLQQQHTAALSADGAAQALQRALVDTQGDLREQVAQGGVWARPHAHPDVQPGAPGPDM